MKLKINFDITVRHDTDEFQLSDLRDILREHLKNGEYTFNDAKIRLGYKNESVSEENENETRTN